MNGGGGGRRVRGVRASLAGGTGAALLAAWLVGGAAAAAPPMSEKLTASDPMLGDEFGWSTALDVGAAAVGLRGRAVGQAPVAGAVVVMRPKDGSWTVTQVLDEAEGAVASRRFGSRMAMRDGLLAIAAPGANAGTGAVYVYREEGGVFTLGTVVAPAPVPGELTGASLAIDGTTVLIGSTPQSLPAMDVVVGKVRVVEYDGGWVEAATLQATDAEAGDRFGFAVAIDGDLAVVGAPNRDAGKGVAYLLARTEGAWQQVTKLMASERADGDFFGTTVAIAGETVLIGAYNSYGATGRAYVFGPEGETWSQRQVLASPEPMPAEWFGIRVALSGSYAMVLGIGYGGVEGGGYLYGRTSAGMRLLTTLRAPEGAAGDYLGVGSALLGGVALLGAPYGDDEVGAAYLLRLAQGPGEACVADGDCAAGTMCCAEVCADGCEAETTTGVATTSGSGETSSGEVGDTGTGSSTTRAVETSSSPPSSSTTLPPSPQLEPLSEGCACRTNAGITNVWVLVGLLGLRRRRVACGLRRV